MAEVIVSRSVRKMAVLWEGITPFLRTGKFGRENVWIDLNENKSELDIFVRKRRKIIRPVQNISVSVTIKLKSKVNGDIINICP